MQIRVGVNTGAIVSGNIGSETRMDYTVVGDNVNVASQLESVSRAGAACISEATYREIEGHIAATKLEPVYVKNRLQPVHVYTVQAAPDGEGLIPAFLKPSSARIFDLCVGKLTLEPPAVIAREVIYPSAHRAALCSPRRATVYSLGKVKRIYLVPFLL